MNKDLEETSPAIVLHQSILDRTRLSVVSQQDRLRFCTRYKILKTLVAEFVVVNSMNLSISWTPLILNSNPGNPSQLLRPKETVHRFLQEEIVQKWLTGRRIGIRLAVSAVKAASLTIWLVEIEYYYKTDQKSSCHCCREAENRLILLSYLISLEHLGFKNLT